MQAVKAASTVAAFGAAVTMGIEVWRSDSSHDMRRKLIGPHARGRVLETCAGQQQASKNMPFYDFEGGKVVSLVLVDRLPPVVDASVINNSKVTRVTSSTLEQFASDSFDTVVDTLGLCAVADPENYLKDMLRVLKPDGVALFMEHGRAESPSSSSASSFVVNVVLDLVAPVHSRLRGCECNREMGRLVREAGFHVDEHRTALFHTSTVITASKI